MNESSDPFPDSLPMLNSPPSFDTEMLNTMNTTNHMSNANLYFDSALPEGPPSFFLGDEESPFPSPASIQARQPPVHASQPANIAHSSASPESSVQDSSSDSSRRAHKRRTSSKSSICAMAGGDMRMRNGPINSWKREDMMDMVTGPTYDFGMPHGHDFNNNDISNRAMGEHFDFDSAASSPSPLLNNASVPLSIGNRHIAIPYRASTSSAATVGPSQSNSFGTRESSPLAMINQTVNPPKLHHSQTMPANSHEDYITGPMVSGMQQLSTWGTENQPMLDSYHHGLPMRGYGVPGPAPAIAPSALGAPQSVRTVFTIEQTPHKSRVETQIPIKMTLWPLPAGIKKLHLPSYTISKPKLMAKPPPPRSPDMLELYTMLVCTSAMQDPVKCARAFSRAAQGHQEVKKPEARKGSSGDVIAEISEEDQPLNGGPVHICDGCILRERKRAARKKARKPEEEEIWAKDEAKRIIVFNTPEVKEWQVATDPNLDADQMEVQSAFQSPIENGICARQIDVPMRIACYCRHQNEKLGFQVIFTIKDHRDNLIAQQITRPIVITDDHKTHAPPLGQHPAATMYGVEHPMFTGTAMFAAGEPIANYNQPLYRNAHSATDLQGLQGTRQQNLQPPFLAQGPRPFAFPQNGAMMPSSTNTPQTRSRQPSPSAQGGPQPKKRKASGSGKIPDGLTMTRIQTDSVPNVPTHNWPVAASNPVSPTGVLPYNTNYTPFANAPNGTYGSIPSRPTQMRTGPPTPNSNEMGLFSTSNRSQSLENMQNFPHMFSTPNSAQQSRAPSPTAVNHIANGMSTGHTPSMSNTAMEFLNNTSHQRSPTIHKIIPNEGTKAGGIEITILGSAFYQGLEVMFGDALATTTTYWGETSLVCLLPPAACSGKVSVNLKPPYHPDIPRFAPQPMQKQPIFFTYIDDDEQELIRQALTLLHHSRHGKQGDVKKFARDIINQQSYRDAAAWSQLPGPGGDQMHPGSNYAASTSASVDVEDAVLSCMELIDSSDKSMPPQYDRRLKNGQSMLHLAASLGYHRLVRTLLLRGANPVLRDRNGMTPMHMAALRGHPQIILQLRSAGGDPTLRSLRGFTPADMATTRNGRNAAQTMQIHVRSKSAAASTVSLSRGSSSASLSSLISIESSSEEESEGEIYNTGSWTRKVSHDSSQTWANSRRSSRRNSLSMERNTRGTGMLQQSEEAPDTPTPTQAAMAVWYQQFAAQLHHFQQGFNLQLPALPPMPNLPNLANLPNLPNLPDYRFGSLVPQRSSRPGTSSAGNPKEGDPKWWDIWTSNNALPPSYDEIYPDKVVRKALDIKTESAIRAAVDAVDNQKLAAIYDTDKTSRLAVTQDIVTRQEYDELKDAHARKVKKLRNDRKLFFIWIPILIFLILAVALNRIPQILNGAQKAITFAQTHYQAYQQDHVVAEL